MIRCAEESTLELPRQSGFDLSLVRLTVSGRDMLCSVHKFSDFLLRIPGIHALCRGWLVQQADAAAAIGRRTDRSGRKSPAAIGTNIQQKIFDAVDTECTFVGANAGIWRIWREVFVAAFTIWTKFKHRIVSPRWCSTRATLCCGADFDGGDLAGRISLCRFRPF